MTRIISLAQDHRLFATLLSLTLVACEGKSRDTVVPDQNESVSAISTGGTDSRTPGSPTSGAQPVASSSYEDGESAYDQGRFDDARSIFENYVTTRPENPFGHYMLGLAAWKSGDFARASEALEQSIALDSTNPKSHVNLARVYIDLGRPHEALEEARQALVLNPTSGDARRVIARAFQAQGQADSAISAYQQALAIDDRDVWAMNNLGVLYLDGGDADLAIPPFARAVQLRGTAPVFQNNLGMALERTGHLALAKQAYEAAIASDSTYGKATVNLDRVNALVVDSTDTFSIEEQAEGFRIQIGMWKDNLVPRPTVTDSVSETLEEIKQ
jgi:tetratricopeptide (TPR) repeat protein